MKYVAFILEFSLLRFLAWVVNLMPNWFANVYADTLGSFSYHLLKKRREMALANLRAAYGNEKSEEEIRRIAKASFQNLIRVATEFVRIPRLTREAESFWKCVNQAETLSQYKAGRGIVVILAHYGNWELMGISGARLVGRPICAIARPIKNPFVYSFIRNLRRKGGVESIDKAGAVRSTIQALKKGEAVGMLIDQHERQGAVWVDFFGRKASTTTLPAVLALKFGVPVVFSYVMRNADGTYQHCFEKPFETIRTGNDHEDLQANTQQYVRKIEEVIRKKPEDWLWMHRRWRKPD